MANAVKTTAGYFDSLPCCEVMSTRLSRTSRSCAGLTRSAAGLCCSMNHEQAGDLRSVKEPLSTPCRNHNHEDKALQCKDLLISKVGGADELSHFAEACAFLNSLEGYSTDDIRSLLELYKASTVAISEDEFILESTGSWLRCLLKEQLKLSSSTAPLLREVEYALNCPFYATLDRLEHRWNIEHFDITGHQMLETSYLPFQMSEEILSLAVSDFSSSQSIYQQELQYLGRWDDHRKTECYSEQVDILFSAIYTSVNQLGAKASALQDRDVTQHLVQIWLDLLRAMMTEVEWRMSNYVPSTEEYITNAALTFALGPIVLPALYLVGPKIPESVVRGPEYNELFRLMSTCGRLMNDIQGYEREYTEGKVNSVSLLVLQSGGSMSIQEARKEIQKPIENCRRELLRLVLRREAAVPRPCKELFWKMCKVCCFFYSRSDGFSSPEEKAPQVNAVIHEPLLLLNASLHSSVSGGVITESFPSA
ncbi:hypothetical protein PR202_ga19085 [Eleusine coracana subsp. coracana]|uniref:Terpene synthase metal-binding domain-containing protein n=1 Tax=Eleusine coracana subsp. coracana TaxID=191504 RepID=A0AAV5CUN8_ELECO|nr:hypothetical protein PR202_ga19085 [Eleusine coracana subsp. coracana]